MSGTGSYSSGGMPKNPTFSTLKISAGGTFDLYNTADQTTNYEALRVNWGASQAQLFTRQAGTGVQRALAIGISTGTAGTAPAVGMLVSGSTPYVGIGWLGAASSLSGPFAGIALGSYNASSGTQTITSASPTIDQSGTAGYTAFDINPTETATGSGTKLLQRWAVGGATRSEINTYGTYFAANVYCNLTGSIGWSTNSSSSNLGLALNRDAADTLALRRGTNAQTFRVYNTYTDASNYERLNISATATVCSIVAAAAGTGTARPLDFGANSSTQWRITTAGHWIALTDNTYDIGANGATRPRCIYVGGTIFAPFTRTLPTQAVASIGASNVGTRSFVTDSTVAAAGNFGAIVVGGGANAVPVFHDGANWRIG